MKCNKNVSITHKDNREFLKTCNSKGILSVGYGNDEKLLKISNTAPMVSTPNINANLGVLNYIDPVAIEILTAVQTADMIAKPRKIGFWGLNSYTYNIKERMGKVSPDDGSANDTIRSTSNVSQVLRGVKAFAGYWGNNDLARSQYSQMQIDLQAEDVHGLMQALAINRNMVFFNGVRETWNTNNGISLPVYGFINDPKLPAYQIVKQNNQNNSTQWKDKTPNEISNDVCVYAYGNLNKKSGGIVNTGRSNGRGRLKLCLSNASLVYLDQMQTIGNSWVSARQLIENNLKGIEIIACPELDGVNNNSDVFYLVYEEEAYGETMANVYVEMARAYKVFEKHSEISQKISQLIGGCVVKRPEFITRWTGINNNTDTQNKLTYFN